MEISAKGPSMQRRAAFLGMAALIAAASLADPRSDTPAAADDHAAGTAQIDNSAALERAREEVTRDVRRGYAVLLEHIELTAGQQSALLALVIRDRLREMTIYDFNEGGFVKGLRS